MQNTSLVPKLYLWLSQKMYNSSKLFYVTYIGDCTVSLLPEKGHSKKVNVIINSKANGVHELMCLSLTAAHEHVVTYFATKTPIYNTHTHIVGFN